MNGTQSRGSTSTPAAAWDWWSRAKTPSRPFRWALVAALVAHGPLVPTIVPSWVWRALLPAEDAPALSDELVLPIDLDLGLGGPEPPPAPTEPAVDTADEDDAATEAERLESERLERERREKRERERKAREKARREEEERKRLAAASASATVPAPNSPPAPSGTAATPPVDPSDPASHAGALAQAQANDTHVKIYLATDRIRGHALGPRIGQLLPRVPQWDELLGGTGLDPIRDFDHLLLTGPHMQSSRVVVAVVDFNVAANKMRAAIERAMKATDPPGEWIETKPDRVGTLGRSQEQVVSMRVGTRTVIVGPAALKARLGQIPYQSFPKSTNVVLHLTLGAPWRPLARVGIKVSRTIPAIEVKLSEAETGFQLELVAPEESAETAARTKDDLIRLLDEVRDNPIPLMADWFDRPRVTLDGKVVRAEVTLTDAQLARLLAAAELMLPPPVTKKP